MKRVVFISYLIILSLKCFSQTVCEYQAVMFEKTFYLCNDNPWVLMFEDNFDGNSLDLSKWELQSWGQGALYNDPKSKTQEYNTLDNITVSNGTLKIIAKKEAVLRKAISWMPENEILEDGMQNLRMYNYTSSNIWTKQKFGYGKYEARIKIPKGKGFWPAFWLFGNNPVYNEIDIFEFWENNTKKHNMTLHYDSDGDGESDMCHTKYTGVDFSQDFHTFTLIWEKDKIEWYVDGSLKRIDYWLYTTLGATTGCTIYGFTQYIMNLIYPKNPMAIILNMAIESRGLSPDNSTLFPSQMEVDWVRYYQKCPCNNTIISDASQYPLDNGANVLFGETVEIDCDFAISQGQQLDIIARKGITLRSGFHAEAGSNFSAKIEPIMCEDPSMTIGENSGLKSSNNNFFMEQEEIVESNLDERTFNVSIYPNPNEGSFSVDFGNNPIDDYSLKLFDMEAKQVFSLDNIKSSIIEINIRNYPKGSYILNVFNQKNMTISSHKIVVQ